MAEARRGGPDARARNRRTGLLLALGVAALAAAAVVVAIVRN